jgi:hypothetical protein
MPRCKLPIQFTSVVGEENYNVYYRDITAVNVIVMAVKT